MMSEIITDPHHWVGTSVDPDPDKRTGTAHTSHKANFHSNWQSM
jgi:hypothetical protein